MSLDKERFLERSFVVGGEKLKPGEVPSITVWGHNLPEAWEDAVLATWQFGTQIPTKYDQEGDPDSRDTTTQIIITSPLSEPRIHRSFPEELRELAIYTQEVVNGVHDHWVRGEEGNGWSYSYHDRLFNWPGRDGWQKIEGLVGQKFDLPFVDQVDILTKKLAEVPHSRRSQAITWNPLKDAEHHEPPCLQRIWCRVVHSEGDLYLLEMNTNWRSRDAFKAAFMNMFAITELQRLIAQRISQLSGRQVEAGRYIDTSDSFHIYGSYIRKGEMDQFLKIVEKRDFASKTWRSDSPAVSREFAIGKAKLTAENG